jgi:hypothetical protein
MRVRLSLIFLGASALAAPIGPSQPLRIVAPRSGILHVSLYRGYGEVPGNVEVSERNGESVTRWKGEIRSYTPENTQTHPGIASFRAGRVEAGHIYEVRASAAGEADWEILAEPNGQDPAAAIQAGMSWLVRSGDSWLSNQPRRGAIAEKGIVAHPEARACIACHITQFTTRAYLTAVTHGYQPPASEAFHGLMARLRDNPRPLYGHPGVNWARVIYSARTVSSRLPVLWAMDRQAAARPVETDRDQILRAARFLLLSKECESGIRSEADGARPEVSGFEIAWQSAQTFRLAAKLEPANPIWPEQAACATRLIRETKPSHVIDAAWRVAALADAGEPTRPAIAELLAVQQPDGRFGLDLKAKSAASDFISHHVLYALALAGYRGPETERLARYTLLRQRADGSWKGEPEYKGFDTPFRDTQFAVMALSAFYPQPKAMRVPPARLSRLHTAPDPWRSPDRDAYQRELLARLNRTPDDRTAIALLAASIDENLGQLREWQRTIQDPRDQQRVEEALRADSQRQATLFAEHLENGPRALKLAILEALATVPSLDGFPDRPRVGNDMEGPQILADRGAKLEAAIAQCLQPRDRELADAAIRAGTALSDVLTPAFTKALLSLPPEFASATAAAYGEGRRGRLVLARELPIDAELRERVRQILVQRDPAMLKIVLPLLAALDPGHAFTRDPYLAGAMEHLLRDQPSGATLRAAAVFSDIVNGPLMRVQVLEALAAPDPATVRAAVDVVLERYLVNPAVAELTIQYLAAAKGLARRMMLDSLDPNRLTIRLDQVSAYSPPRIPIPPDLSILSAPYVQDFVLASLEDKDAQVRAAALDLTRKQTALKRNTRIAGAAATLSASIGRDRQLDFEFFRERIHPLLEKPGADGRSCVMCHASNARFPLRPDAASNFRAMSTKVDVENPAESPVLVKPLLPPVTPDGDVFRTSHNGGERWPERTGSTEYQTILEWIRGARR